MIITTELMKRVLIICIRLHDKPMYEKRNIYK